MPTHRVTLPTLHSDQVRAYHQQLAGPSQLALDAAFAANDTGRFKVIRCGRRWGKSKWLETWLGDGAARGMETGLFAPDYKKLAEIYQDMTDILAPIISAKSKTEGVIRTTTGGRVDFWTLENESAGRSRKYRRVGVDEGAFTKPNMMDIWKQSIKPTLLDYSGSCVVASNTNGIDPENFLWQLCNQAHHGFIEYHAPSINNPLIPMRLEGESEADHAARRLAEFEKLRLGEHPLVWAQEYLAEFVDWSGVAFFDRDKMLEQGQPVEMPLHCDYVFAVVDTATKTGTDNDGTAVTYFARTKYGGYALLVLDWEVQQIEGDLLEAWMPTVLQNLESLAARCGATYGSLGVMVEDKSSGMVLLQHFAKLTTKVRPIDSKLTSVGKDERAVSVSGYHYRGEVKITRPAYEKTTLYKGTARNHLMAQVTGFRIGDKKAASRADDLLDTYTYGIALSLGDAGGF